MLIIVQTILLAVDAGPSVFDDPRDKKWGTSPVDYVMLVLFIIYTIELVARCIVSGFIVNPPTPKRPHIRASAGRHWLEKAERLFSPLGAGRRSTPASRAGSPTPLEPTILRSFTNLNMMEAGPAANTIQSQARVRLARRAFLRHSFNRLDFLAVVSYWISLALTVSGMESERHLYVFRMMSCLRILRLLGITTGTSVILRSLKKAAPLLVHVAFLIGFFWLVFAVIGVQSFKGSLRRTCVWVDPEGIQPNFTQAFQFCGGHIDPITKLDVPYVNADGTPGSKISKGYICPENSLCVADQNPYGGTMSFDNIAQSLELVFVVMTSNTFSNVLYYTADSDYLTAALCKSRIIPFILLCGICLPHVVFVAGVVILAFWLANLLIAVITSSFQVIREESKKSAFAAEAE